MTAQTQEQAEATCPLCGRVLGTVNVDRHHLVPKKFKGREQFPIHKICHRKIHSAFTERELLTSFHTWDDLRRDEDIQTFIRFAPRNPAVQAGSERSRLRSSRCLSIEIAV